MKKRVLLVDDAAVIRSALSLAIAQDQDLEIAGTAANGRVAVSIFPALKPDIVLLDFKMPEMDGFATVREIRERDSRIPIIMFSNLTERGAAVTLEALSSGVTDYVTKPSDADMMATVDAISRELLPKIRALCHLPEVSNRLAPAAQPKMQAPPAPVPHPPRLPSPVQIVAIGVSTGGPDALARVLPSLPANFPVPVVVAQHIPPIFASLLASRLSAKSILPVRVCVSGEPLRSGRVIIAPGDFHMVLSQDDGRLRLQTNQAPKENFCRPSVDVLFHSVARVFGARALAVVLTGMGQDGLRGCETLRGLGAQIYVQDEASSVVWGMPGLVARSGLAHKILPLDQIGAEIVRATALKIAAHSQG